MKRPRDTIAAVSTAPGIAGVAVIRVSGPEAGDVVADLVGTIPPPRKARLSWIRDPVTGDRLDRGLVLWFPAPNSFTGEPVAEFQIHGGRAVIAAVLQAVQAVDGVRLAEPGEFTRRAFEHGRLDLAAVEGLADLLAAETEAQRQQALDQASGRLAGLCESWRGDLVQALALVEATIDFADEAEITDGILRNARFAVETILAAVDKAVIDSHRGERIRDGLTVVLAGKPNAGKSTLLNLLASRDVAIVSPQAGTTRDALEVHLDIGGMAFTVVDTAGLRETVDAVEVEGTKRTRNWIEQADLVLWLHAIDDDEGPAIEQRQGSQVWLVVTQCDLRQEPREIPASARHVISAVTSEGLDKLLDDLRAFGADIAGGEPAVLVRARHRELIADLGACLQAALARENWIADGDLVAEDLRRGLGALGRVTGRTGVDALLDVIFGSFCLGK